jgi:hypothetical protein
MDKFSRCIGQASRIKNLWLRSSFFLSGMTSAQINFNLQIFYRGPFCETVMVTVCLNWILFHDQMSYVASNSGVQQVQSGSTKQPLVAPFQIRSKTVISLFTFRMNLRRASPD